jgi:hypothetical protein
MGIDSMVWVKVRSSMTINSLNCVLQIAKSFLIIGTAQFQFMYKFCVKLE